MKAVSTLTIVALAVVGCGECNAEPAPTIVGISEPKTDCGSVALGQSTIRNAEDVLTPISRMPELTNPAGELEKDEFETTAAYNDRVNRFWAKALNDDLDVVLTYALIGEYDADQQVYKISSPFSANNDMRKQGLVRGSFHTDFHVGNGYIGQTDFGVQREVTPTRSEGWEVVFPASRLPSTFNMGEWGRGTIYMRLAPEKAKQLKERGRLYFVGQLKAPWMKIARTTDQPTISDPTRRNYAHYQFSVTPLCFAIALDKEVIIEKPL